MDGSCLAGSGVTEKPRKVPYGGVGGTGISALGQRKIVIIAWTSWLLPPPSTGWDETPLAPKEWPWWWL